MNQGHRVMLSGLKKIFLMVSISLPLSLQAQNDNDLVNFLTAGPEDASKLMNAYLNPVIEGLSYGFNGGWYHTAKAHKTLGFDIGVALNAVFIPSSKNYFDPATLGLKTITDFTSTASNGLAPTIAGPADDTTYDVDANGDNQTDATFSGPQGLDFKETFKVSGVLSPTVQLGLGVYKNTDIKIRWMPEVSVGSSKIKLFGVGIMHDIKQHIPGMKLLPFDLSILVAYTNIKGNTDMSGPLPPGNDTRPQVMDFNMDAWLFQALISKKISVITFYGGIGYNTIKTSSAVTGTYIIPETQQELKDPVSLLFKNNSARLNGGMRLSLGPIYLSGEYTLQKYNTVSVGIGATVR